MLDHDNTTVQAVNEWHAISAVGGQASGEDGASRPPAVASDMDSSPNPYSIGRYTYGNNTSSTSTIKIWNYQHDTVYLNIYIKDFDQHYDRVREWKAKACESSERRYEVPGLGIFVQASGSVRYPYVLYIPDVCIVQCTFSPMERIPQLRVHVLSEYIFKAGGKVGYCLADLCLKLGDIFGYESIERVQIGELHLCVDFTGWCPTFDDVMKGRFVGRMKKVPRLHDYDLPTGDITSMSFGEHDSPVSIVLYDKVKEIEESSHKDYLLDYYATAGYEPDRDGRMMRLELRYGRESLREGGIDGIGDIDDAALLRYALGDYERAGSNAWLSLRSVDPDDTNRWRWDVSPVWVQLCKCAVEAASTEDIGTRFVRDRGMSPQQDTLVKMVVGCASGFAAIAGVRDIRMAFVGMMRRGVAMLSEDGSDYSKVFAQRVRDKRLRYGILTAG